LQRRIFAQQLVSHSEKKNEAEATQNSDEKDHQNRLNNASGKKRSSHSLDEPFTNQAPTQKQNQTMIPDPR
jgi:hypothetical protein